MSKTYRGSRSTTSTVILWHEVLLIIAATVKIALCGPWVKPVVTIPDEKNEKEKINPENRGKIMREQKK